MNIKNALLALSIALFPSLVIAQEATGKGHENRVLLTSELLAFSDGKPFGIHADYIGFMLQIIHELDRINYGEKISATEHRGIFTCLETQHTLKELCALEMDVEAALKKESSPALMARKAALKKCLDQAINHFATKILPFNEHARGVQKLIMTLIEESCTKRNRTDSFLLTWGECPEGKEVELLTKQMVSIKRFETFLTDLTNFLKDIIYSCPKARSAFLALVKQKMNKNGNSNTSDNRS